MAKDTRETMIRLCYALLDDEHGINEKAHGILLDLLKETYSWEPDFLAKIEATDGRFYLPEGWNK